MIDIFGGSVVILNFYNISLGFLILLHMLMDDYITHLLESKLEKEDEKVYSDRLQQMKKGTHTRPLITGTKSCAHHVNSLQFVINFSISC